MVSPLKRSIKTLLQRNGFIPYWDDIAQAPYMYSAAKKQLLTYDDERSMTAKTRYALAHHLGGIMFWELADDKTSNGLLDVIYKAAASK